MGKHVTYDILKLSVKYFRDMTCVTPTREQAPLRIMGCIALSTIYLKVTEFTQFSLIQH